MPDSDHQNGRPHGRDEVVSALVSAAARLFADRGPAAVSLRDVAGEANVNLGLIHRYIGGKNDLLVAVLGARPGMEGLDAMPVRTVEDLIELVLAIMSTDALHTRVLLRTVVEGFELRKLQDTFPLVERAAGVVRSGQATRDADLRVAFIASAALGWQAFGARFLEILEQPDIGSEEMHARLRPALHAFLTTGPTPGH